MKSELVNAQKLKFWFKYILVIGIFPKMLEYSFKTEAVIFILGPGESQGLLDFAVTR